VANESIWVPNRCRIPCPICVAEVSDLCVWPSWTKGAHPHTNRTTRPHKSDRVFRIRLVRFGALRRQTCTRSEPKRPQFQITISDLKCGSSRSSKGSQKWTNASGFVTIEGSVLTPLALFGAIFLWDVLSKSNWFVSFCFDLVNISLGAIGYTCLLFTLILQWSQLSRISAAQGSGTCWR
jgi:hypothetical protein